MLINRLDGQVNNSSAVLNLVSKFSNNDCRTYALGIGNDVDLNLIQGLANNGGGSYEFTGVGESIQSKVIRLLKRALDRFLDDVNVDWGSLEPSHVTPKVSSVVSGDRILVYALLDSPPKEEKV